MMVFESLLWCHRESNQGHTDFQSVALPTELWHQPFFWLQRYIFFYNAQRTTIIFLRWCLNCWVIMNVQF